MPTARRWLLLLADERAMMVRITDVAHISCRQSLFPDLVEAWRKISLAWLLARRNVKVRYTQTILGRAWIVIQPLALTGVMSVIFGKVLAFPSEGLPYTLFVFTGTALWSLIARAMSETSASLAMAASLLSKVYFPRILVPVATIITAAMDFLPVYACVVLATALYGLFPGWQILLSPLMILLALIGVLGAGLWLSAFDAIYRDVRLLVPHAIQLLFYVTPVIYSASAVPARWQWVYDVNPLVGLFRAFRWTLIAGAEPPSMAQFGWVVAVALLLFVSGLMIFARLERVVVDRL
jgi:lipopolysaccharide transport system permease protein